MLKVEREVTIPAVAYLSSVENVAETDVPPTHKESQFDCWAAARAAVWRTKATLGAPN